MRAIMRRTTTTKAKGKPRARAKAPAADSARALAQGIAKVASDHKAHDIVVLDMHRLTSIADYFIVCSGASDRQVTAIADAVRDDQKKRGRLPLSEEGLRSGHWVLLDYGDVVLHVFYQPTREHYRLERLWFDAPRLPLKGINA
jgi:ribosome-associated protein